MRIIFLLLTINMSFTATGIAQQDYKSVNKWLLDNLHEVGGRAVVMIYKDGKVVYNHAENYLNLREKMTLKWFARKQGKEGIEAVKDFDANTVVPIASCSKWLSAALVMTFVEEGKLSLDDTVGKYLPLLSKHEKGKITLWQCLSHLTGIKAPPLKESIEEFKGLNSMDEAVESIANLPMEGTPGKCFHYSNVGLQIAAAILEKISGQSFERLFQQRIAMPCGLKNTSFGNAKVALAAGGASSSATDYLRFITMILQDGVLDGHKVLKTSSIIAMQQLYTKDAVIAYSPTEATPWVYGFGEWIMETGTERAKVVSSPGLFGTFPWVDNQRKYAAILVTYNLNSKGRHERYLTLKTLIDQAVQ